MNVRTCFGVAAIFLASVALAQPTVTVTNEWVRATPPGSRMTAGYLTLHNAADHQVTLVSVSSPHSERVELHRTTLVDDVARMEKMEALDIPAGGSVELAPGGLHLMLIGLRGDLREGGDVTLHLVFDDGWEVEVEAQVRRR